MIIEGKKTDLILDIEENKIFCANGDFAIGFKISYPEIYSKGENDFSNIYSDWIKSFRLLPLGSIVVKTDMFLKEEFSTALFPKDTFLQRGLANHFDKRNHLKHTGYIFFVWSKRDSLKNTNIGNPFNFPSLKKFEKEDIEQQQFEESIRNIQAFSSQSQIKLVPLSETEIRDYEQFYFNGFQTSYTSDLYAEKNKFSFQDLHIGIVSVEDEDKLPDFVETSIEDKNFSSEDGDFIFHEGFMDKLGLKFRHNHILNQILIIDDHDRHIKNIYKNRKELYSARRYSPTNQAGVKKLDDLLNEVSEDSNSHLTRGHINLIYWSDKETEFRYLKEQIVSVFNSLSIKPNVPTREQLKNIYYNSFFTNVSFLSANNCFITDLRVSAAMLLSTSNYKSDEKGIYLVDRVFNTPVLFDFWDEEKKHIRSRNFCIIAPTGAGKSFTANYMFRQLLEQDVTIVIIDLGGSYIKFSKLLPTKDVEVFSYKEGEPLGLNPFMLSESETAPSSLKVEELGEFIWTLIKKVDEPTENEKTSMRKLINYYYEMEEEEHSWESFYSFIDRNKNTLYNQLKIDTKEFFNLSEFLHAGSDFVGEGNYSNLLKKKDNSQNFVGKKLIIFELDTVKENHLLLTIMLQVISEAIQKTIWKDRTSKGIVFFDEFAKQLQFPNVFKSVKHYMEAIRKHNGGCGIVLQTINQLPNNDIGNTLIDQIQTKIFVEADDYKDAIKRLSLGSHVKNQLYSIRNKHTGEGYRYSEIYVDRKGYNNVYRIEASKEEYTAYQTEGVDHTEVLALESELGSMENAILTYLENKNN